MTRDHVLHVLVDLFANVFDVQKISPLVSDEGSLHDAMLMSVTFSQKSDNYAKDGYLRTDLTSDLISIFISGVIAEVNEEFPSMSRAYFDKDTELKVEVLKRYTYEATIMSPRLKVTEYRGYQIVKDIFEGLSSDEGYFLLPDDHKTLYLNCADSTQRRRVFCDFIAGMTDRYAIEFYSRLYGENPQSIFKPV